MGARFGDHRLLEIALALESVMAAYPETRRPLPDINALSNAPRLAQAIPAE